MASGCTIQRELEGVRTVIRVSGTFDRASAVELAHRLEDERGDELVVDFSHVREFADLGVATLAHGLAGAARPLQLRGLRQHQVRIFRYFGLDVRAPQVDADAPAGGQLS